MNQINQTSKRVSAFFILLFLFLCLSMPIFAQTNVEQKLNTITETILSIVKSNFVKTILTIALIASGIAFVVNKDNQRLRAGLLALLIGTAIITLATYIVDLVWSF